MNRKLIFIVIPFLMITLVCFADEIKTKKSGLETTSEKFSYIMGKDVITALKKLNTKIDLDAFMLGAEDCYYDKTPLLTPVQIAEVKKEISKNIKQKQKEKLKSVAEKNLKEGELFLAENKNKEGVISTQSGLQYKILKEGSGVFPKPDDEVIVNYRGILINGKEFDSSYRRGGPTKVRVKEVLPGWAEALQKMRAGSHFRLFLPARLAYGPHYSGTGGVVGPNSAIIFEVELIEIAAQKGK